MVISACGNKLVFSNKIKIKKEEKRKKYYSPISAWRKYISTAFATNKKNILIKANPKKNKYRFFSF